MKLFEVVADAAAEKEKVFDGLHCPVSWMKSILASTSDGAAPWDVPPAWRPMLEMFCFRRVT